MKDKTYKIISVVSRVALVVATINIISLKNDLKQLENSLNNHSRTSESRINDIYNNVNSMLRRQEDILEESNLELISADKENLTAVFRYTVKPKEYNPGVTKAAVTLNDETFDMEYIDGHYTLQLTVPVFGNNRLTGITLTNDGNVRYQQLGESMDAQYQVFPVVHADLASSWRYSHDNNTRSVDGDLHIVAELKGEVPVINSVELVQVSGGVEILRQKMESYDDHSGSMFSRVYPVKETFNCPKGVATYLYADVTDGDGYVHRCLLEVWDVEADGKLADKTHYYGYVRDTVEIFNPKGDSVYKLDLDITEVQ